MNDKWTPVVAALFVSDFIYSNEPVFSADGKTLTFTGTKATGSPDLWAVKSAVHGWGMSVARPAPINTADEDYPSSIASDGTMYFSRAHSGLRSQLYKAREDGSRQWVVELPRAPRHAQSYEGDPCIAPDGHFLVCYSARVGGHGGTDLYVSFRDARGSWGSKIGRIGRSPLAFRSPG